MQALRSGLFLIFFCCGVSKVDSVPRYKSIIPLDSNAAICSNLCFQDPGSRSGPLSERARTFLEEIQGIERYGGAVSAQGKRGRARTDLREGR